MPLAVNTSSTVNSNSGKVGEKMRSLPENKLPLNLLVVDAKKAEVKQWIP
ncbi:MAG: hypothetical protein P5702_23985 [Limnospira sp. PMC 1291.21]|nr:MULTISPECIES: hypothetical protein [unclassified Limnospira]MDT9195810.1 hypothetical protein [Limnospira sp. PMC 1245.20]MDT9201087.1 hypothetical protein [Limnospira sp. PMC 1042.18]MDT9206201.1 hypothetical protein [Limnospira sp. PMC 1243.20]MDT9211352.1 hypothetical protein [Limnospira sp. PMC 1252.20]MDT9216485.1 hypothetical protein [Limnospira sp. PMC 1256.20]